jgi:hypothetical protein
MRKANQRVPSIVVSVRGRERRECAAGQEAVKLGKRAEKAVRRHSLLVRRNSIYGLARVLCLKIRHTF